MPAITRSPSSITAWTAFGVDAGQRDERQNLEFGFQNIDRRLPGRLPGLRAGRPEQLTMHPLGAREHLARFRPHPVANDITGHFYRSGTDAVMCAAGAENSTPGAQRRPRDG